MTALTLDVTLPRPHAGQIRLDEALKGARFGVVMCGRRFGKTKYGIYRACRAALEGERVGWFAPTYKYALEAWREITHRFVPSRRRSPSRRSASSCDGRRHRMLDDGHPGPGPRP
jgi:hypothetical protein